MEPIKDPIAGTLDANGALARSGALAIDSWTGCGAGYTTLLVVTAVIFVLYVLERKKNSDLVFKMFDVIPSQTAAVLKAVSDFKNAIKNFKGDVNEIDGNG